MKEDKKFFFEYSATCRHTSVAGNMIVFRKAHGVYSIRESRWHRDIIIVLDRIYIDSVRDFFCANSEEKFHRACTNGTLKSIAAVRSNAPNCMLQGSKSDPMHACMHKDCLETRLNMRKTQSAKQISRFRMFIELLELRTK